MRRRRFKGFATKELPPEVWNVIYSPRWKDPEPEEDVLVPCDNDWVDPAYLERQVDNELLARVFLDVISDKHAQVLVMHLVEEMTLQEIADHFRVTRERIRQIELEALRKINYWTRNKWRLDSAIKSYKESIE
jgi:RNA polymerase sigma factor (sigma-70 family)